MATIRNLYSNNAESRPNSSADSLNSNSSLKDISYWESRLFSSVYLRNDLKRDFSEKWQLDFDDQVFDHEGNYVKRGFYHFYNEFRNIAESLRGFSRKNLSETDTITKIIVPLLDALGWHDKCSNSVEAPYAAETSFTVQGKPKNKTYRTDMILVDHPQEAGFISDPEDNERRKKEARRFCILPLEAKYWNLIVEKEKSNRQDQARANKDSDDTGAGISFNEQILNYMNILHRKWGIVTDGNIWRLLNSEISGEASERCFEFRIESLLVQESKIDSGGSDEAEFMEAAKYFYLFFGKASFIKDEVGKIFVDEVLRESRKYIDSIEEDLKDRFIAAMNVMCNGLLKSAQRLGTIKRPTDDDLKLIRTVGESHLFNVLFIKSCEARGILPIKSPSYYDISLTGIIDRISVYEPEKYTTLKEKFYIDEKLTTSLNLHNYKPSGFNLYNNLIKLTQVIHDGAKEDSYGFEIKGFKESIFSKTEWTFAAQHQMTDQEMVSVLFELGYSKTSASMQRNYQQIPYNYFTPRQLGSIYESFLEYKLDIADEKMVFLQKGKYKQWTTFTSSVQNTLEGFEPIVGKGQLYFTPDNSDRKATGSYYTPAYIPNYIVKNTIGPLCNGKTSEEILSIKVCDPAMGSGHFLISALNFLTDEYLNALEVEVPKDNIPSREKAKRIVLGKCIYGIDINARAVKLAKMSLWLESAHHGKKLENLDDQLINRNSLIDSEPLQSCQKSIKNWMPFDIKSDFPKIEGFDVCIGNPPWGASFSEIMEKILLQKYATTNSKVKDSYKFFFFLAFNIIKENGRYGWVIPNGAVFQNEFYDIRKEMISRKNTVIVNLGDGVFSGVTAPSCIITGENTRIEAISPHYLDLSMAESEQKAALLHNACDDDFQNLGIMDTETNPRFYTNPTDFNLDISELLVSEKTISFESVVEKFTKGVETGCNDAFLIDLSLKALCSSSYVHKILRGSDFEKFKIRGEKKAVIILNGLKESEVPRSIIGHLEKHRSVLKLRAKVRAGKLKWYEVNSPKTPKLFTNKTILIRQTGDSLIATKSNGSHSLDSVHNIVLNKNYIKHTDLIVKIINSEFMNTIYQAITNEKGRTLAQVKNVNVFKLPFPKKLDELERLLKLKGCIENALITYYGILQG